MKKPNILFLLSDDQGAWATAKNNDEIISPNLDRLSKNGVTFESFFCVSPVCSPARLSIFTGKIPSAHGVHDWIAKGHIDCNELSDTLKEKFEEDNLPFQYSWPRDQLKGDKAIRFLDGHRTFTNALAENGYNCAISGKWHMGDSASPQAGFTDFRTLAMGGDNYMYPVVLKDGTFDILDNKYVSDYITENAIDILDNQEKDKPFYLSVHYTAPHAPWDKHQHPEDIYNLYENCEFENTPNVPIHKDADIAGMSDEKYQENRIKWLRGYYTAITAMDKGIGEILDKLEQMGELDNTIIIFTSDNGMSMGHHGIFGKGNGTYPMNMYDTAVKIPMIISYPKEFKSNIDITSLHSHYDIYPTLMDILNINSENLEKLPGHSFKNVLVGNEDTHNDDNNIVVFDEYGPVRMIRNTKYKYIHRYGFDNYNEFYDLTLDPDELINNIDNPLYYDIIESMRENLEQWFVKYGVPKYDGKNLKVHGIGQIAEIDNDNTNGKYFK